MGSKKMSSLGGPTLKKIYLKLRKVQISLTLLYLSGINMMEGILTNNNWLRFPPKPKEAKLYGRRLFLDPSNKILIQPFTI